MAHVFLLAASLALPGDRWFARDKLKHFLVAAFTQSVSYSVARLAGVEHRGSIVAASAVTVGVSLGKEFVDGRRGRGFSAKDLVWDVAGGVAATAMLNRAER